MIRFWILMTVLGSLASGADDPPLCYPYKIRDGEYGVKMNETFIFLGVHQGVIKGGSLLIAKKERCLFISKGKS